MTPTWFVALIPLLGAALLARKWPGRDARYLVTGILLLTALVSLWRGPAWPWRWFPGIEPMALSSSLGGIYAAWLTLAVAILVIWFHPPAASRWSHSILLVAVAATNVAFMADHFLLRYAALEVVAVTIVLGQFLAAQGAEARRLRRDYALLRMGDAGLISAILILSSRTGTLLIDPALKAGLGLPAEVMPWAIGGFVLAVVVKLGLWPLGAWQRPLALDDDSPLYSWLYLIAAPNLGLYLLYRVTPLLGEAALGAALVRWLALLVAVVSLGRALLARSQAQARMGLLGSLCAVMVAMATMVPPGLVWIALMLTTLPRAALALTHGRAHARWLRTWRDLAHVAAVLPLYLALWWAGPEIDPLLRAAAELVLGLYLVCAWRVARRPAEADVTLTRAQSAIVAGLTVFPLAAYLLAWRPLLAALGDVAHVTLALPTVARTATHLLASPLLWLPVAYVALRFTPLAPRIEAWLVRVEAAGKDERIPVQDADKVFQVAVWLLRFVERGVLETELQALTRFAMAWRDGIRFFEERILNADMEAIVRIVSAWRDGSRYLENRVLDAALAAISSGVVALSESVQRTHTGKLRYNLIWVPVALALAIAIMLAM